MKIIGISGSLRTASLSTALLKTAAALAPYAVNLIVYDGLGYLPHFNPDLDREPLPSALSDFRSQLNSSAGVIISTPEYAHGVPGVLKNCPSPKLQPMSAGYIKACNIVTRTRFWSYEVLANHSPQLPHSPHRPIA